MKENTVLEVRDLSMHFGGLYAVDKANLSVKKDEITALIGPNGAGKTTFFNCVTGLYTPTTGKIFITPQGKKREEIDSLKPHKITNKGIARTFQNIRLFQNMTALENVMAGRHRLLKAGILHAILRDKKTKEEEEKVVHDSYEILEKIGLTKYINELAKNLPYGAQRRLEIARALATDPFILLLDEPAAGMNPNETRELDNLILRLKEDEKLSILLIEHDMSLVMRISDRIYVMDYGKIIAEGKPEQIRHDPLVIKAYLGENYNV
ncbi:MAG: ABC transporter ATP-binding protein [Spirochaetes bacterium]|nr:ABC transporter ATP-binding protein [Spirochaetota bacterium]